MPLVNAGYENAFLACFAESCGHVHRTIWAPPNDAPLQETDADFLVNHFIMTTPRERVLTKFRILVGDSAALSFLLYADPFHKLRYFTTWRNKLVHLYKLYIRTGRLYYERVPPPPSHAHLPAITEFYLHTYALDGDETDEDEVLEYSLDTDTDDDDYDY